MSDDERAAVLTQQIYNLIEADEDQAILDLEAVIQLILVGFSAVRTEEREACAKVVEEHGDRCISPQERDDWYEARIEEIAAAIRAAKSKAA